MLKRKSYSEFWALKDTSFSVPVGETFGIVGSNGSGKSTILKLIAGILRPDKGGIIASGKVSALLELGTGFHPELTGRENVYLNGSMLGLSRREIGKRFDDIVAFSGLEEFIDTPVKNYSSGMYARLAFAVAINVDPDILLIDEVLAVGDEAFQTKCYEKISDFRRQGKTIIFVSHSLDTVRTLCSSAIWLEEGMIKSSGKAIDVVSDYVHHVHQMQAKESEEGSIAAVEGKRWGSGEIEIGKVELLGENRKAKTVFETGEPLTIRISYHANKHIKKAVFGVGLYRDDGLHITGTNTKQHNLILDCPIGDGAIEFQIPELPVLKGKYLLSVTAHDPTVTSIYDWHERMYNFSVVGSRLPETIGFVNTLGKWEINPPS